GGRGIGRATALLLARAGASVAVGYRERKKEAEETTEAVKAVKAARAVAVGGDLSDAAAARRAVGEAIGALGGLDLPIANPAERQRELRGAGVGGYGDGEGLLRAGQAGDRSDDSAGTGREPGGHRRSHRVSVLGPRAAYHGRDPECEWGLGALRMTFPKRLPI